jgi:hypothetical protein
MHGSVRKGNDLGQEDFEIARRTIQVYTPHLTI